MKTRSTRSNNAVSYGQCDATCVDRLCTYLVGRTIKRHVPRRSALHVLDLGCGYHAIYLQAIYPRLRAGVGIDFQVSEEVQQIPGLHFVLDSIESALPRLPDEEFDVILFISVLEHISDGLRVLQGCHRVLKPGGLLMLNVPTWLAKPVLEFSAFHLNTSPRGDMEDHKMYYDKRTLWPLLVRAGFKPSQIRLRYRNCKMTLFGLIGK